MQPCRKRAVVSGEETREGQNTKAGSSRGRKNSSPSRGFTFVGAQCHTICVVELGVVEWFVLSEMRSGSGQSATRRHDGDG